MTADTCPMGHVLRPDGSHLSQQDYFTHPAESEMAALAVRNGSEVEVPAEPESHPAFNGSKLQPWQRYQLLRELALRPAVRYPKPSNAALGRKYGITGQAVGQVLKNNRALIEHIRANMEDPFAGLWIASKTNRVAMYQRAAETLTAGEVFSANDLATLQKAVAEELGQLPPRLTVSVTPVIHILEGVDTDELR